MTKKKPNFEAAINHYEYGCSLPNGISIELAGRMYEAYDQPGKHPMKEVAEQFGFSLHQTQKALRFAHQFDDFMVCSADPTHYWFADAGTPNEQPCTQSCRHMAYRLYPRTPKQMKRIKEELNKR